MAFSAVNHFHGYHQVFIFRIALWMPPPKNACTHYSLSPSSHMQYWKVEFAVSRLHSPHRSQVSHSLSSRVKPCRLTQALDSLGSGLLLPWEQVPERCCQLFPASSFAVGVWESWASLEPGPVCLSRSSLFTSPTLSVSDGMYWYESLMPQFPYATSLLPYFAMGIVPSHIHTDELHSMDQQCLLLMCVSGGCLVSRMLIYGVFLAENKHQLSFQ